MKTIPIAVSVLLLAATASWAGPPKDAAEFAARDAEGRWASVRAAPDPVADWVAFLAARRDWELLEWLALTSRTSEALRALEEADAPPWIRCALWRLAGADSHADEEARALLLGRRGGTVLDYLERRPETVVGPVVGIRGELRNRVGEALRLDSSRHLPAWAPAVLLALLDPPASVEGAVPSSGAVPGIVYAQQVERALLAWARSALRGEEWAAKVERLLAHEQPAVRRAASTATANLSANRVPKVALARLLDDGKQPRDVRAAAAVGYSFAAGPEVVLKLLHAAEDPAHPAWSAAVSRLGDVGDEFAAQHLSRLPGPGPGEAERALREGAVQRIRARIAAEDAGAFAARVGVLLRRAAWADTHCDPLETDVVPFVTALVTARAKEPAVRAVLEETKPTPGDDLSERASEYAKAILAGQTGNAK